MAKPVQKAQPDVGGIGRERLRGAGPRRDRTDPDDGRVDPSWGIDEEARRKVTLTLECWYCDAVRGDKKDQTIQR